MDILGKLPFFMCLTGLSHDRFTESFNLLYQSSSQSSLGKDLNFIVSGSENASFWKGNLSIRINCDALNVGNWGTWKTGVLGAKLKNWIWQTWPNGKFGWTENLAWHPRCQFGWSYGADGAEDGSCSVRPSPPLVLLGNPIEYGGLVLIVGNRKCRFNSHQHLFHDP